MYMCLHIFWIRMDACFLPCCWLPLQVAALVAMLCGDDAKQITGSALVIDGGGLAQ